MSVKRFNDELSDFSEVERKLKLAIGRANVAKSEARSWQRSLPAITNLLLDAGLEHVEVIPEYRMPLTSKRADVVLAGVHPETGKHSYVVIELKQWSKVSLHEGNRDLVDVEGVSYNPVLHPGVQVAGYCDYMADFVTVLHDSPGAIQGAAYLHNANDLAVQELFDAPQTARSQVFTESGRGAMIASLQKHLAPQSGVHAADSLLKSPHAPSKKLLELAAVEIQSREQFVLLDEQKLAYEYVLHEVQKAHRSDQKTAVIITGGPGTGKSVIALSLLGELARQGKTTMHATGSKSFTTTLRRHAGKGSTQSQKLFKYFNSFMEAEPNQLDVLICDEAHRVRETSVNRYTKKEVRAEAEPQIKELLRAARVPVFLLDEFQTVRPGEMGSVSEIRGVAAAMKYDVKVIPLAEQFRCAGSEEFISWVKDLLMLEGRSQSRWDAEHPYQVQVAKSPGAMEAKLRAHNSAGFTARITAGYCWTWTRKWREDNTLNPDVKIGDWGLPWNSFEDRTVGDVPPASLWATDAGGINQVGCVYTAQGFEYDWNGVIFGDDLVWRTDHWEINRSANKDPDFKSLSKVDDDEFAAKIKNVYKVLLTRGMQGCILYSTDTETQLRFEELLRQDDANVGWVVG